MKTIEEHIKTLTPYPKLYAMVDMDFGSIRLKEYLSKLMADAYDGHRPRDGFPKEVSESIIAIANANQKYLEDLGLNFDEDPSSQFTPPSWFVPRNF